MKHFKVIKKYYSLSFLIIILLLCSFIVKRNFPDFTYVSYKGRTYTEKDLRGKKTIVALFHLGCPPAMVLMNDLDSLQQSMDTSRFQILGVLENTEEHIHLFYSDSISIWPKLRKAFKTNLVQYPLLAECKNEMNIKKDSIITIGDHCRGLSKKLHTKDSPTLYLVNEKGKIIKTSKGYIAYSSSASRKLWLEKFLIGK